MFWGLTMLPNKRYTQAVENAFRISQAVLDPKKHGGGGDVHVVVDISGKSYIMCTLRKRDIVQVPLDLVFSVGDKISLYIKGDASVHLTGYIPYEDSLGKTVSSENLASGKKGKKVVKHQINDGSDDDVFDVGKLEDDDDDDESEDDEKSEEGEKSESDDSEDDNESASDDDDDDDEEEEEEEDDDDDDQVDKQPTKKMKMDSEKNGKVNGKLPLLNDTTKKNPFPKSAEQKAIDEGPKIYTKEEIARRALNPIAFANQVYCEDLRIGKGPEIKNGQRIQVYYVGRLESNNKVFDSAKKGPGFKFLLGKHEVIRGWDLGVLGMKVGGKRRLIIPPMMAYGTRGSPPVIPSNATLIFDIEIRAIL